MRTSPAMARSWIGSLKKRRPKTMAKAGARYPATSSCQRSAGAATRRQVVLSALVVV